MKRWAEKRREAMAAMGYKELADIFELVVRICELEEQLYPELNKDKVVVI